MSPTIIYPDIRLRHKFFLMTLLIAALCILPMLLIAMGIALDEGGGAGGAVIALIVVTLLDLAVVIPILLVIPPYFRSLRYEIHDDEVIVNAGVITKSVKHVPFRTITNLEVNRGPLDRFYGIGGLKIQTAGFSGQQGAEENLLGLTNVQQVYEQVAAAVRRYRQTAMDPTQASAELKLSDERALLTELLAEVKAIRASVSQTE